MKKLPLLGVAVALLVLSGCATGTTTGGTATFADADAQTVLFGKDTQASLAKLGYTAEKNVLSTASVETYLANVSSIADVIDPAKCANTVRPLLLPDRDVNSQDTFYGLPHLITGGLVVTVQARLFPTDADAEAFLADFHKAVADCPKFTDTQGSDTIGVVVSVSDPDPDGRGFFMDTVAGTSDAARAFRTYIVRQGNLAIAVQGVANTADADTLLVNTTSALYTAASILTSSE
ncbi:MAG: hypothetical protein KF761_04745 [Salinibacterium sp.]|nr:hypothetical protein [Salinibacterium sp.]